MRRDNKKRITESVTVLLNGYPAARARLGVGLDKLLVGMHPPCTLKVLRVHLQIVQEIVIRHLIGHKLVIIIISSSSISHLKLSCPLLCDFRSFTTTGSLMVGLLAYPAEYELGMEDEKRQMYSFRKQ